MSQIYLYKSKRRGEKSGFNYFIFCSCGRLEIAIFCVFSDCLRPLCFEKVEAMRSISERIELERWLVCAVYAHASVICIFLHFMLTVIHLKLTLNGQPSGLIHGL